MATPDHYVEAADGLQAAAKALRACGVEESGEDEGGETPRSEQPKSLRDAGRQARRRIMQGRGEKTPEE